MKLYDNHTHTRFSPDGKMNMDEAVDRAVELGLGGICFSDHYDIDIPGGSDAFSFDIRKHQEEIDMLNCRYGSGIKILKGIELGLQKESLSKTRSLADGYEFDSVIASIHFLEGLDPYYGEYYLGKDRKHAYMNYYETMYDCIREYEDFDILGHFDYIARYSSYEAKSIKYKDFPDHFDTLFRYLSENGKVLELNTKSYDVSSVNSVELDPDILRRYSEMGGEAVSLGSDAHAVSRIAEGFQKMLGVAVDSGIRYVCHFENRKMVCDRICL